VVVVRVVRMIVCVIDSGRAHFNSPDSITCAQP
jgi:hypothetical protein